eukprot:XP_019919134.1 PREDICTED: uncharacterized protein LOC105318912 [Crassostrea gigas]
MTLHACQCVDAIALASTGKPPITALTETRNLGLASVFAVQCNGCKKHFKFETSPRIPGSRRSTVVVKDEETCLISAVLDREDVLFGEFKGPGGKSGVAKRRQGWEEVADAINAQFTSSKRSPEECRKKYNNAKQRTKEKSIT